MPDKKIIGCISIVTDDSTGMYNIGEVDGGFDSEQLKEHIESYGKEPILSHLANMTHHVIETFREISQNQESKVYSNNIGSTTH